MYNIGDKVEIATKLLTRDIILRTEIMTITKIYSREDLFEKGKTNYWYACDGNDYIHYAEKRILRKVSD